MESRSKKIPWNRHRTASVTPRKKMLIPRHSEVYKRVYLESQNGRKCMRKKNWFTKTFAPANRIDSMFLSETCFGTEFRVVVSSPEWFGKEIQVFASYFVPWYRIPSIFIHCGTLRNGIPRIFCSAEQLEFRRNKPIVPSIPSSNLIFLSEIANSNYETTMESGDDLWRRSKHMYNVHTTYIYPCSARDWE